MNHSDPDLPISSQHAILCWLETDLIDRAGEKRGTKYRAVTTPVVMGDQ
jgi:hypothetical protein